MTDDILTLAQKVMARGQPNEWCLAQAVIDLRRERDEARAKGDAIRPLLQSIADNSCCQPCREAGLWAQKALRILDGEGGPI